MFIHVKLKLKEPDKLVKTIIFALCLCGLILNSINEITLEEKQFLTEGNVHSLEASY